jgi:hypothetical protein
LRVFIFLLAGVVQVAFETVRLGTFDLFFLLFSYLGRLKFVQIEPVSL